MDGRRKRRRKLIQKTIPADAHSEVKPFRDDELKCGNDWQWTAYDSNNLMSAHEVMCNFAIQSWTYHAFESGIIGRRRIQNDDIPSSSLSAFKTLGPRGESGIIKKCPVTTEYGFTLVDKVVVRHGWIDVSKQLLKTLECRLSDAYGTTIDLRDMPMNFSLIFMLQDD